MSRGFVSALGVCSALEALHLKWREFSNRLHVNIVTNIFCTINLRAHCLLFCVYVFLRCLGEGRKQSGGARLGRLALGSLCIHD